MAGRRLAYGLALTGPMALSPSDARPPTRPSAIHVLADPVNRAVVLALGEAHDQGIESLVVTEEALADATPRLIRSRLRDLERAGIVEAASAGPNQPRQWLLTTAGRDLFRLHALMTRIVLRASRLPAASPPVLRERAVAAALSAFADPVVMQITRVLAAASGPIGPTALEEGCQPVARRTLYRRLTPLLEAGVVERTSGRTVPRTTFYALTDRWRPTAAVPMLAAWWESRHWSETPGFAPSSFAGVLQAALPLARMEGVHHGKRVLWRVTDADGAPLASGALAVDGDRLRAVAAGHESLGVGDDASSGSDSEAIIVSEVSGSAMAWGAAMVSDRRDDLILSGDATVTQAAIAAVRAVLLAYVR